MGQDAHALVGGLQAAEQVLEVAVLEEGGLREDVRRLQHLSLLHLHLAAAEVGANQREDLQRRIGQLEDDIGEDAVEAECDDALQEGLELLEVLPGPVALVLLELRLGLGELAVVDCGEALEHLLGYVEVALAVLGQGGLQRAPEEMQGELQL